MSTQDPIADMLTRMRNAQAVGEKNVQFQYSNFKLAILNVLKSEGYIEDCEQLVVDGKKKLQVKMKYYQGRPVIEKIQRVSKPGLRIYKNSNSLSSILGGGMGIAIISTSKGVMSEKAARTNKLGGEVICIVE